MQQHIDSGKAICRAHIIKADSVEFCTYTENKASVGRLKVDQAGNKLTHMAERNLP